MEDEKLNLISEKDRRERDCRNMQVELNRMNTVFCVSFYLIYSNTRINSVTYPYTKGVATKIYSSSHNPTVG